MEWTYFNKHLCIDRCFWMTCFSLQTAVRIHRDVGFEQKCRSKMYRYAVSVRLTVRSRLHGLSQADAGRCLGGWGGLCAAFSLQLGGAGKTSVPHHAKWTLRNSVVCFRLQGSDWLTGLCSCVTGSISSNTDGLLVFILQLDRVQVKISVIFTSACSCKDITGQDTHTEMLLK